MLYLPNMKPSKTVFITSFHPLISRNIVNTAIPALLVREGFSVVVLVPEFKIGYFREAFKAPGVTFQGVVTGAVVRTKRVGLLKRLAEALPDTVRANLGRRLTLDGRRKSAFYYYFFYYPAHFLGKSHFAMKFIRLIDYLISPRGRFALLIDKYQPALIFSTDVQNENDVSLMQDGKRAGIPIVGMVRSWDNLVMRAFRFLPSRLIVHSELLKRQAIALYGIKPDSIVVTGIPHYDRYLKEKENIDREVFLRQIGLDPAKKTILFFPLCDYRVVWDSDGRRRLVDLEVLNALAGIPGVNIIVRFPPNETVSIGDFSPPPNFYFDRPGVAFGTEQVTTREVSDNDDLRLMKELAVSDVVVMGPSTAVIDAVLFNKPVVFVDFSSDSPRLGNNVGQAFEYESEHILDILRAEGTRSAHNDSELRGLITEYLTRPDRNEEGRQRIVREQCFRTDGLSSKRVVDILLEVLHDRM